MIWYPMFCDLFWMTRWPTKVRPRKLWPKGLMREKSSPCAWKLAGIRRSCLALQWKFHEMSSPLAFGFQKQKKQRWATCSDFLALLSDLPGYVKVSRRLWTFEVCWTETWRKCQVQLVGAELKPSCQWVTFVKLFFELNVDASELTACFFPRLEQYLSMEIR